MKPTRVRGLLTKAAARHGAAALLAGGVLMLLLAAWRLLPAGVLTADMSTLSGLAPADGRPTLLVLFQSSDCSSYSAYLQQWNTLAREGEVRVVGVPLNTGRGAVAKPVVDYFTPAFPLRHDLAPDAATLLRQMGQSHSPVAVLLDPAGRPRMIVPPGRYVREHVQARMAVRDYTRAMFPLSKKRSRS